ncbi:MAG: hypothetical protein JSS75_07405 [Bacteroidetes bacterium]|nr:hypothetical protein [Bacteroidota bacterium]
MIEAVENPIFANIYGTTSRQDALLQAACFHYQWHQDRLYVGDIVIMTCSGCGYEREVEVEEDESDIN